MGVLLPTPVLTPDLRARLDELDQLRATLGAESHRPSRWMGTLRRLVQATSVESSTAIEGFPVSFFIVALVFVLYVISGFSGIRAATSRRERAVLQGAEA